VARLPWSHHRQVLKGNAASVGDGDPGRVVGYIEVPNRHILIQGAGVSLDGHTVPPEPAHIHPLDVQLCQGPGGIIEKGNPNIAVPWVAWLPGSHEIQVLNADTLSLGSQEPIIVGSNRRPTIAIGTEGHRGDVGTVDRVEQKDTAIE